MSLSYPSNLIPNPYAPVPADLAYAAALAGAADRMSDAATLDDLWPLVAEEALTLIPADGAVITALRGRSWSLLAVRAGEGAVSLAQADRGVAAADQQGLLTGPGPAANDDPASFPDSWRSILVVPLDRQPSRIATRLIWFTGHPEGLQAYANLADLLARHAGAAARAVTIRESLGQAVDARHRVGQAQGILMARYQITADQAFAVLVRHSQHTNTKLRTIAENLISTGRLNEL